MISYERAPPLMLSNLQQTSCYFCQTTLEGANIFYHPKGGEEHPLHKRCAISLHEAGFNHCMPCILEKSNCIRCDPLSLHPRWQRNFRQLANTIPLIATPLIGVTISGTTLIRAIQLHQNLESSTGNTAISLGSLIGVSGAIGYGRRSFNVGLKVTVISSAATSALLIASGTLSEGSDPRVGVSMLMTAIFVARLAHCRRELIDVAAMVLIVALPTFAELLGSPETNVSQLSLGLSVALSVAAGVGSLIRYVSNSN